MALKQKNNHLMKISIEGYKSIKSLTNFDIRNLNILIGGNGAGKSNFIDFFRLLRAMQSLPLPGMPSGSLKNFVELGGGSEDFLFNGSKNTKQISASMMVNGNSYSFTLTPTANETFLLDENSAYNSYYGETIHTATDNDESSLIAHKGTETIEGYIHRAISSWKIYHFHDTSKNSPLRLSESVEDNEYLRFDGANIAPYLMMLKERYPREYRDIVNAIRMVTPFFEDFVFKPTAAEKVRLLWIQKGSDYPLKPHHFSDGTLRFIALATALLQPNPPSIMLIDEPELGLHPDAISLLAEMMQSASHSIQLIVSTQSPTLVDYFAPEDVIVVNRKDGASTFTRLSSSELEAWLEDYSLGDLWRRNFIAGVPTHE